MNAVQLQVPSCLPDTCALQGATSAEWSAITYMLEINNIVKRVALVRVDSLTERLI
jgi:hypothetical protein